MGTYNVMRKGTDCSSHPLDVGEITDASQRLMTAQLMASKLRTLAVPSYALENYGLETVETVLGIDGLSRYGLEGIVQRITDGIRRLWQYLVDKIRQVIAWVRGKSEAQKEAEFKAAARKKYRDFVDSYRDEYGGVGTERNADTANIAMPIRAFKVNAPQILTDNLAILPGLTKRLMDVALFSDEFIDPLLTKWDDSKLTHLAGFRDNRLFANFHDLLSPPEGHTTLGEQLTRALDNKVKAQSLLYALRYNQTATAALATAFPRNRKDFEKALSRGDTLTVVSSDGLFHFDVTFPDPTTLINAPTLVSFNSDSALSDSKAQLLLTTLTITVEDDAQLDEAFSRGMAVKAWRKEHLEVQGYELLDDRVTTLQSTYEQMAKFNRGKTSAERVANHTEGLREDTYDTSLTLEELNRQHNAYLAGISSYTLSLYSALSGPTQRSLLSLLALTNTATRLLSQANTLALEV